MHCKNSALQHHNQIVYYTCPYLLFSFRLTDKKCQQCVRFSSINHQTILCIYITYRGIDKTITNAVFLHFHKVDKVSTVNGTEPAGCPLTKKLSMNRALQKGRLITGKFKKKICYSLYSVLMPDCAEII